MNKEEIENYITELESMFELSELEEHSRNILKVGNYIKQLQQENKQLKNKIKELVKYGFGTDMSLGEFKEFYKLGTGKDYDPKKCPEVE